MLDPRVGVARGYHVDVTVEHQRRAVAVELGRHHALILMAGGAVWSVGETTDGECGIGGAGEAGRSRATGEKR